MTDTKSPADSHAIIRSYAGKSMPIEHQRTFVTPEMNFATRTIKAGAKVRPLTYSSRPLPDFPIAWNGAIEPVPTRIANRIPAMDPPAMSPELNSVPALTSDF